MLDFDEDAELSRLVQRLSALYEGVEINKNRVDEISQNTVQNAFHKVRAITASKHTPDQAYVHTSLSNNPPIDPKYTSTHPLDAKQLRLHREAISKFNAQRRKERANGSASDKTKDTLVTRTDDFNKIPVEHNNFYPQAKKALNGRNDVHLRYGDKAAILASGEKPYVRYRDTVTPYHNPRERLPVSPSV